MRPPTLSRAAREDFDEALRWYMARSGGAAARFSSSLRESIETIGRTPEMFPTIASDVRRALLADFPYGVYYRVRTGRVRIVGIVHLRRDPRIGRSRG